MNLEDPTLLPHYVTCQCRHCDENIEFDANAFAEEFSAITCPHCGLETNLYLTVPPGDPATAAQLDYIRRMGFNPPAALRFREARILIEELLSSAPATAKQLESIRQLGGTPVAELFRAEADQIVGKLLTRRQELLPPEALLTHRQMKLLRLWDRMDLALSSPAEVEAWLREFQAADPRRIAAWKKFQSEYGNAGSAEDLSWVPLGLGESYLNS